MTGLAYNSTSLAIGVLRAGESTPTRYDADLSANIEGITTIGTYAAPTSGKVRFGEVGGGLQGFRGWYEVQFAAALFAATNDCRAVAISVECPGSGCHAGLYLQLRPQKADLARIDGEANAEATLQLSSLELASDGMSVTIPSALAAPDVTSVTTWGFMEYIAFIGRFLINKLVISKSSASMTLYMDDGTTPMGSSTISDDGTTQTRGPIS